MEDVDASRVRPYPLQSNWRLALRLRDCVRVRSILAPSVVLDEREREEEAALPRADAARDEPCLLLEVCASSAYWLCPKRAEALRDVRTSE